MSNNPRVGTIKRSQKESLLLREIASHFMQITRDNTELHGLIVTRVTLSPDKSKCTIFIHGQGGLAEFEEKRQQIVLYKASLRKALSQAIQSRYVPQLRFVYDAQLDKQRHIDDLIDKLKDEGNL